MKEIAPERHKARLLLTGAKHMWKRARSQPGLVAVTLLITLRCNLRCPYCDFTDRSDKELDTQSLLDLISKLRAAGTIRFSVSGGEPLLRDDLVSILHRIRELGGISSVTTNGTLIEQRPHALEAADFVFVTVEGDGDLHDQVRGEGCHGRTLAGLVALRKSGAKFHLLTPVSQANCGRVHAVIELAQRFNCKVFFQPVQAISGWQRTAG